MNRKTEIALRQSITKWKQIVAGKLAERGTKTCPLCQMFNTGDSCDGCPVAERTGFNFCGDTPYWEWHGAFAYSDFPSHVDNKDAGTRGKLVKLAQAELDFLISLLPPDRPEPRMKK